MKVNQTSMDFRSLGSWGSAGKGLATSFFLMFFMLLGIGQVEAQSTQDWTGNRSIVGRQAAIQILKVEIDRMRTNQPAQTGAVVGTTSADVNALIELSHFTRVYDLLVGSNRSTKEAINDVTNEMISEGYSSDGIKSSVKRMINLLS
jgi:hypothetical protein